MRRTLALVAVVGLLGLGVGASVLGGTAGAAGTVNVTPNANLTDGATVTVSWTGLQPFGTPSIVQCKNNPTTGASGPDCEFLTLQVAADASNASGAGSDTFVVHDSNGLAAINDRTGVRCDVDNAGAILVADNPNDLSSGSYKSITCAGSSVIVTPADVLLSCTGLSQIASMSPPMGSNSARYTKGAGKDSIGDRDFASGGAVPADATTCTVGAGIRNHNPATDYVAKPGAKPVVNPFDNSAKGYSELTTTGPLAKTILTLAGSTTCQTVAQATVDNDFPTAYPLQGKLLVKWDNTYPNATNTKQLQLQTQAYVLLGRDATDPDPTHWTVSGTVILGPGLGGELSGTVSIAPTTTQVPPASTHLRTRNLNPTECTDTDVTDDATDATIFETAVTLADGSDADTAVDPLIVSIPG